MVRFTPLCFRLAGHVVRHHSASHFTAWWARRRSLDAWLARLAEEHRASIGIGISHGSVQTAAASGHGVTSVPFAPASGRRVVAHLGALQCDALSRAVVLALSRELAFVEAVALENSTKNYQMWHHRRAVAAALAAALGTQGAQGTHGQGTCNSEGGRGALVALQPEAAGGVTSAAGLALHGGRVPRFAAGGGVTSAISAASTTVGPGTGTGTGTVTARKATPTAGVIAASGEHARDALAVQFNASNAAWVCAPMPGAAELVFTDAAFHPKFKRPDVACTYGPAWIARREWQLDASRGDDPKHYHGWCHRRWALAVHGLMGTEWDE